MQWTFCKMRKNLEAADLGGNIKNMLLDILVWNVLRHPGDVKQAVGWVGFRTERELEKQTRDSLCVDGLSKLWDLTSLPREENLVEHRGEGKLNLEAFENTRKKVKETEKLWPVKSNKDQEGSDQETSWECLEQVTIVNYVKAGKTWEVRPSQDDKTYKRWLKGQCHRFLLHVANQIDESKRIQTYFDKL